MSTQPDYYCANCGENHAPGVCPSRISEVPNSSRAAEVPMARWKPDGVATGRDVLELREEIAALRLKVELLSNAVSAHQTWAEMTDNENLNDRLAALEAVNAGPALEAER